MTNTPEDPIIRFHANTAQVCDSIRRLHVAIAGHALRATAELCRFGEAMGRGQ